MAPRHQTLPPAQTPSAKHALQSFYCHLCSKGYSRVNDYEAHLGSYDHSHKQRMKDMKAMVRDPNAVERARKAEAKANGIIPMQVIEESLDTSGSSSYRKGGFKKSMQKPGVSQQNLTSSGLTSGLEKSQSETVSCMEEGSDDEHYCRYDPYNPTE